MLMLIGEAVESVKVRNTQMCTCQNLGTSSRPQYKQDKTLNTVNGDGNEERGRVVKRENTRHISFLSFPHFYWLLLVILNL